MSKLPEYIQTLQQGDETLENHNKLLESLLLSKQNDCVPVYTDQVADTIPDGSIDSSEGIS
jgi:hypothetical protein